MRKTIRQTGPHTICFLITVGLNIYICVYIFMYVYCIYICIETYYIVFRINISSLIIDLSVYPPWSVLCACIVSKNKDTKYTLCSHEFRRFIWGRRVRSSDEFDLHVQRTRFLIFLFFSLFTSRLEYYRVFRLSWVYVSVVYHIPTYLY